MVSQRKDKQDVKHVGYLTYYILGAIPQTLQTSIFCDG